MFDDSQIQSIRKSIFDAFREMAPRIDSFCFNKPFVEFLPGKDNTVTRTVILSKMFEMAFPGSLKANLIEAYGSDGQQKGYDIIINLPSGMRKVELKMTASLTSGKFTGAAHQDKTGADNFLLTKFDLSKEKNYPISMCSWMTGSLAQMPATHTSINVQNQRTMAIGKSNFTTIAIHESDFDMIIPIIGGKKKCKKWVGTVMEDVACEFK
jgi:hypothetical protein